MRYGVNELRYATALLSGGGSSIVVISPFGSVWNVKELVLLLPSASPRLLDVVLLAVSVSPDEVGPK